MGGSSSGRSRRRAVIPAMIALVSFSAFDVALQMRSPTAAAVTVLDSDLEARLAALAAASPTFRAGLDTLSLTGFRVILAQPSQARRDVPGMDRYAPVHLGEVIPMYDAGGALTGAVVTIDVPRLRGLARAQGLAREDLESDIERILMHEIYGHVVPLAVSRSIRGGCPDPAAHEPATSSCAIQRENRVRTEVGLPERTEYDLSGLAIGGGGRALATSR